MSSILGKSGRFGGGMRRDAAMPGGEDELSLYMIAIGIKPPDRTGFKPALLVCEDGACPR